MNRLLRNLVTVLALSLSVPACESIESSDEQNVTATSGTFETFTGEDGQTYFALLAKNGERILRSEGYTSLASAKKAITSVKTNGVVKARFKVLEADSGEFYFNLTATNNKIIGTSEMYASKSNAEKGVTAVIAALDTTTSTAAKTGTAKFETFKGASNKSYFRLRAGNGQIVLQSQAYSSTSAANNGVASVEKNAIDASNFEIIEGQNGQHTFRLLAANGQVIGRGEMYVSKSNALRGAARVREIVRELTDEGAVTDAEIKSEVETTADGLLYTSESDFPFEYVSANKPGTINIALVTSAFASLVDNDEAADKPMATLFAMERSWQDWKDAEHNCADPEDIEGQASCNQMRALEQVLEANLTDIHVFYYGKHGSAGNVDGTGVSIFIVGRSPSGTLVGVRTIAIWT